MTKTRFICYAEVLFFKIHAFFGPHYENVNEYIPTLSAVILVAGNVKYSRGFLDIGAVKRQWGNRRTLHLRNLRKQGQQYYLVPRRLFTDPQIHDLE